MCRQYEYQNYRLSPRCSLRYIVEPDGYCLSVSSSQLSNGAACIHFFNNGYYLSGINFLLSDHQTSEVFCSAPLNTQFFFPDGIRLPYSWHRSCFFLLRKGNQRCDSSSSCLKPSFLYHAASLFSWLYANNQTVPMQRNGGYRNRFTSH